MCVCVCLSVLEWVCVCVSWTLQPGYKIPFILKEMMNYINTDNPDLCNVLIFDLLSEVSRWNLQTSNQGFSSSLVLLFYFLFYLSLQNCWTVLKRVAVPVSSDKVKLHLIVKCPFRATTWTPGRRRRPRCWPFPTSTQRHRNKIRRIDYRRQIWSLLKDNLRLLGNLRSLKFHAASVLIIKT